LATFKRYEDIEVWQLARQLAKVVYALTRTGAFAKDYGLKDQIQRAAVSIGSNIAEGFERAGNKEFANFLWIAKGSAGEVGSQLYTAYDVGYVSKDNFEQALQQSRTIGAKIYRLIESMSASKLTGVRYRKPETRNPKLETRNPEPETI